MKLTQCWAGTLALRLLLMALAVCDFGLSCRTVEAMPNPLCHNALTAVKKPGLKEFTVRWHSAKGGGTAILLIRKPVKASSSLTAESEREFFVESVDVIDDLIVKGKCPRERFDIVFVYPGISYAISAEQLKLLRAQSRGTSRWRDHLMMRLTVARL